MADAVAIPIGALIGAGTVLAGGVGAVWKFVRDEFSALRVRIAVLEEKVDECNEGRRKDVKENAQALVNATRLLSHRKNNDSDPPSTNEEDWTEDTAVSEQISRVAREEIQRLTREYATESVRPRPRQKLPSRPR